MAKKENLTVMQEAVKLWKECKVQSATFTFSCGGDDMSDTEWEIKAKSNKKKKLGELESLLDDLVYKEVEFYVNSDGHYQGEFGIVDVTIDEDDKDDVRLFFVKDSTSEFTECYEEEINVEMNETEKRLFTDYIQTFVGGRDDNTVIDYKMDCILSDEEKKVIDNFIEKISEITNDLEIKADDYDPHSDNHRWNIFTMVGVNGDYLTVNIQKNYTALIENHIG